VSSYAQYALSRVKVSFRTGGHPIVPDLPDLEAFSKRIPVIITIHQHDGEVIASDLPVGPDVDVTSLLFLCANMLYINPGRSKLFGLYVEFARQHHHHLRGRKSGSGLANFTPVIGGSDGNREMDGVMEVSEVIEEETEEDIHILQNPLASLNISNIPPAPPTHNFDDEVDLEVPPPPMDDTIDDVDDCPPPPSDLTIELPLPPPLTEDWLDEKSDPATPSTMSIATTSISMGSELREVDESEMISAPEYITLLMGDDSFVGDLYSKDNPCRHGWPTKFIFKRKIIYPGGDPPDDMELEDEIENLQAITFSQVSNDVLSGRLIIYEEDKVVSLATLHLVFIISFFLNNILFVMVR